MEEAKPVFYKSWYKVGIEKVKDLLDAEVDIFTLIKSSQNNLNWSLALP